MSSVKLACEITPVSKVSTRMEIGFATPIALLGGFIFGKWLGTIIVVIGMSVGATFLYIFGNYFLKDLIRDKFLNRYQNLERKFKKSEFYYLLIYRFIGGIPWQLSCILPTIFDVRVKNFFFASLIGIIPQIFLAVSLGSGLEKVIEQNSQVPKITDIIFSPEIYFLTDLPSKIDFSEVFYIIFTSISLSILASIFPSWKAAKILPAEVLRYE